MNILFADKFPEARHQTVTDKGHSFTYKPDLTAESLPGEIGDHDVLVVRSTKVTPDTIGAAKNLKLIIRAGAGTNTIDKAAANQAGIHVCNCPGMNSAAVAELAMGLMLAIDRRIPQCNADLKQGQWNKKEYAKADGVKGKTMGILGMGAIGKELAKRAQAFDMKVLGFDVVPFDAPGVEVVDDIDKVLAQADVVSCHVPLNDKTKHLIDARRLGLMKQGATLINTSRGAVIDEQALIAAIKEKGLWVGADVFEVEPATGVAKYEGDLGLLDHVVGTHHIGASTQQAQLAVADEVLAVIEDYVRDKTIRNEVKA